MPPMLCDRFVPVALASLCLLSTVDGRASTPPRVDWFVEGDGWGTPAADFQTAFYLSRHHEVIAIDVKSGKPIWRRETGGRADVTEGVRLRLNASRVFAGDEGVVALDRNSGRIEWRTVPSNAVAVGRYLGAATEETVFAGSASGQLCAIDATSGAIRWLAAVAPGRAATVYAPRLDGDLVIARFTVFDTPVSGGLVAVDAGTGHERWRVSSSASVDGAAWAGGPEVCGDVVVLSEPDGDLVAFRRSDGGVAWTVPRAASLPVRDFRALAASATLLVAGSLGGRLMAYSISSIREKWRFEGGSGSVGFGLVVDDRAVYAPYTDGRLVAVSLTDGRELWRTSPSQGRFDWPPVTVGNHVYASADQGFIAIEVAR
jgi:outer membrane protein assembly factor BamB